MPFESVRMKMHQLGKMFRKHIELHNSVFMGIFVPFISTLAVKVSQCASLMAPKSFLLLPIFSPTVRVFVSSENSSSSELVCFHSNQLI